MITTHPTSSRKGAEQCVVLDKAFLQGASASTVGDLSSRYTLVMPGALFFELMTTSATARARCFAKLPRTENPVRLVDHVGQLLRDEIQTSKPCGRPSNHALGFRFQFNTALLDRAYQLPIEASQAVADLEVDVQRDVERLVDRAEIAAELFPGLLQGSATKQAQAHAEAEAAIGRVDEIVRFYEQLEAPAGQALAFPVIAGPPQDWAHIRWLQVLMLFATDLHVRYRGTLRAQLSANVRELLEHDVHDAQMLAIAVLEGAIATREKKLLRWWRLLKPDGLAFS